MSRVSVLRSMIFIGVILGVFGEQTFDELHEDMSVSEIEGLEDFIEPEVLAGLDNEERQEDEEWQDDAPQKGFVQRVFDFFGFSEEYVVEDGNMVTVGGVEMSEGVFRKFYKRIVNIYPWIKQKLFNSKEFVKDVFSKLWGEMTGKEQNGDEETERNEDEEEEDEGFHIPDMEHETKEMMVKLMNDFILKGDYQKINKKRVKKRPNKKRYDIMEYHDPSEDSREELETKRSMPSVNNLDSESMAYKSGGKRERFKLEMDGKGVGYTHKNLKLLINDQYITSLQGLVNKFFSLSQECADLNTNLEDDEDKLNQTMQTKATIRENAEKLEEEMESGIDLMKYKKHQMEEKGEEKRGIEQEIKDLEQGPIMDTLRKNEKHIKHINGKIEGIKNEHRDNEKMKGKYDNLIKEVENLQKSLNSNAEELDLLRDEIDSGQIDLDLYLKNYKMKKNKVKGIKINLDRLRKTKKMMTEWLKLKTLVTGIKDNSGQAKEELTNLYQNRQITQEEMEEIIREIKELDPEFENIKELVDEGKYRELRESLKDLHETAKNMDFREIEEHLENLNRKIKELEDLNKEEIWELKGLQGEKRKYSEPIERKNKRITRLQDEIKRKEKDKQDKEQEIEALRDQLAEYNEKTGKLQKSAEQLQKKKRKYEEKFAKEMHTLKEKKTRNLVEMSDLRDELEKVKKEVENKQGELDRIKSEVGNLKNKEFQLRERLRKLDEQFGRRMDERDEVMKMIRQELSHLKEYVE